MHSASDFEPRSVDNVAVQFGTSIWDVPRAHPLEPLGGDLKVEVAVIGGGLTGLAAAIRAAERFGRDSTCIVDKRETGAGASVRTGGVLLDETAGGGLPGTEEVVESVRDRLEAWQIDAAIRTEGALAVARRGEARADFSSFRWNNSGILRVVERSGGGDLDPGKLLGGLWARAHQCGVRIHEQTAVERLEAGNPSRLYLRTGGSIQARYVVIATNGAAGRLLGFTGRGFLRFETFAMASEPLDRSTFSEIGWEPAIPFYTLDLPYLWGRSTQEGRIVIGSGLARTNGSQRQCLHKGEQLVRRFHTFHPRLRHVSVEAVWSGPITLTKDFLPRVTSLDPEKRVWAAAGYCGHGVALGIELGVRLSDWLSGKREPLEELTPILAPPLDLGPGALRALYRLLFSAGMKVGGWLRLPARAYLVTPARVRRKK